LGATLGTAAALLLIISGPVSGPARAQSATQHRAAVIIDTGTTVKHVCIRFTSDSISGKDALDLANQVDPSVHPMYRDYGGLGAAVCSLCGTGNPQSDCLGQQSGKFWAYDRAPNGTTRFAQSSEGLSNTQVHDGDVEGWYWGQGGAPPYASVDQVCGTLTTDGTFTPTSVSRNGGPPQPVAGPAAGSSASPQRRPPQPGAAPAAGPPPSTSTSIDATAPTSVADATSSSGPSGTALAQLPRHGGGSGGGGSWAGLVAFGAIGTGLAGWFWWVRHARRAVM
jgi:hypothetical protein